MDPKLRNKLRVKEGEIQRILHILNETLQLDYEHQIMSVKVYPYLRMLVEIEVARVP